MEVAIQVGEIIQWCNWLAIIVLLGIFYKGRIFSKVINIVLNIFLGTFWELIVILGVIFILHIQAGQIWSDPVLSYSIQGFSKILILISILGLKQYNGKNKNNISFNYTKELLGIVVIDMITIIAGIYLTRNYAKLKISLNEEIILILCGIFLISFVSILIVERLSERAKAETELKLRVQQLELEEQYHQDLKQTTSQLRALRHDMNNHIGVMKGLLKFEQYDELEAYFSEIADTMQLANKIILTGNRGLGILLGTKVEEAEQKGIEIDLVVTQEEIPIAEKDLCALAGNLIDNAMEATKQMDEKYIFFAIQKHHEKVTIKCENTYSVLPKVKKNGTFFTTKKDKQQHGIGTKIIQEIVEKYHGTQEIQCAETFMITIHFSFANLVNNKGDISDRQE